MGLRGVACCASVMRLLRVDELWCHSALCCSVWRLGVPQIPSNNPPQALNPAHVSEPKPSVLGAQGACAGCVFGALCA